MQHFNDWVEWFTKEYGQPPSMRERECYFSGWHSVSQLLLTMCITMSETTWRNAKRQ